VPADALSIASARTLEGAPLKGAFVIRQPARQSQLAPEPRSAADLAMERYADGDDSAFATLYDELAPALYGYLLRQTGSSAVAEDGVQQTLLQIHCARDGFVRGAAVRPWAFAIARRLVIDGYRKEH
jgi:RNA polymerase sigma-70 factor (ECF subfamily)